MSNTKKSHGSYIRLHVIPEPAEGTRSVMIKTEGDSLVFQGSEAPAVVMVCGDCGAHLIKGVPVSRISNLVLKCRGCGAFNETVEG
jgi:hypothetical protein